MGWLEAQISNSLLGSTVQFGLFDVCHGAYHEGISVTAINNQLLNITNQQTDVSMNLTFKEDNNYTFLTGDITGKDNVSLQFKADEYDVSWQGEAGVIPLLMKLTTSRTLNNISNQLQHELNESYVEFNKARNKVLTEVDAVAQSFMPLKEKETKVVESYREISNKPIKFIPIELKASDDITVKYDMRINTLTVLSDEFKREDPTLVGFVYHLNSLEQPLDTDIELNRNNAIMQCHRYQSVNQEFVYNKDLQLNHCFTSQQALLSLYKVKEEIFHQYQEQISSVERAVQQGLEVQAQKELQSELDNEIHLFRSAHIDEASKELLLHLDEMSNSHENFPSEISYSQDGSLNVVYEDGEWKLHKGNIELYLEDSQIIMRVYDEQERESKSTVNDLSSFIRNLPAFYQEVHGVVRELSQPNLEYSLVKDMEFSIDDRD